MSFKSDIEITQEAVAQDIRDIAKKINLSEDDIELYGKYKAKIDYNVLDRTEDRKGKLILTTAINPTPAGEGKTTTSIAPGILASWARQRAISTRVSTWVGLVIRIFSR